VLGGPTVINCLGSADGLGMCLRGKLVESGLMPGAAPAVVAEAEAPVATTALAEPALDVTPEPETAPAVPDSLVSASFGLLRAEPDGSVVIAGSGKPGTEVEIYSNDVLIGRAEVEPSGDWVFVPDQPLPTGGNEITLAETGKEGRADQSFAVMIDADREDEPLVVASTPGAASEILQGLERSAAGTSIDIAAAEPPPPAPEAKPEPASAPDIAEPSPADVPAPVAAPEPVETPAEAEPEPSAPAQPTATLEVEATPPAPEPERAEPVTPPEPQTAAAPQAQPVPEPEPEPAAVAQPAAPPSVPAAPEAEPAAVAEAPAQPAPQPPIAEESTAPAEADIAVAAVEPEAAVEAAPVFAASPPTIDAIEVEGDRTFFAGSGPEGATIRLYVDGNYIADAIVADGRWLVEAGNVLTKPSQRIRVDLLRPGTAEVAGRAEVDFVIDVPAVEPPVAVAEAEEPAAPIPVAEPASSQPILELPTAQPADEQPAPAEPAATPEPAPEPVEALQPLAPEPATQPETPVAAPAAPAVPIAETPAAIAPVPEPAAPSATAEDDVPTMVAVPVGDPEAQRYASGKAIIRRGDNLWTIARRVYGAGMRYTTIYEANTEQIRDPDLIYPGQVFDLPNSAN